MDEINGVLVVGGGLAGLAAGTFLAWQKTPVVVVEKHPGSSPHPRAIGYTPRTMQFVRALGIGDQVPEVDDGIRLRRQRMYSLAGEWYEEAPWTPGSEPADMNAFSPVRGAAMAQDRFEPILRRKAIDLGADVRLSTELIGFDQDDSAVTATLRDRKTGREYDLRADYMIAADGTRSTIREQLGIERDGVGHLRTMHSILFKAPLEEYLESGVSQFIIDQGDFQTFITTYRDGRWVLYANEEVTDPAAQEAMIRRAIGRDDVPIELINFGSWDVTGLINETYRKGRIFLMGDAAHTLPPTRGGWGANTGIDDANNLAWKLTSVLSGLSTPALLDTYDAERQPIGKLRHDQTFSRPDYQRGGGEQVKPYQGATLYDDVAMELGQLYRSGAVIGARAELPPAAKPDEWVGQPGTLAPHMWVEQDGRKVSTMDFYLNRWTLVTEDDAWRAAAEAAAAALGIAVTVLRFGEDVIAEDESAFRKTYGVDRDGASLIRPDGYVAWRAVEKPADPASALIDALGTVACAVKALAPS